MRERLFSIIKHPAFLPASVGIVSFGLGTGIGYILARRAKNEMLHDMPVQLAFNYDDMMAYIESEEARQKDNAKELPPAVSFVDDSDVDIVEKTGANFIATKIQEAMTTPTEDEPVEEVITNNVFAGSDDDDWDYESEVRNRTETEPYVIHKDEFYAEESGYTQTTLTYYAGDNIMADEDDVPLYNFEAVVGPLKFGHGSGDPKVFHVRNDKRKAEYEIIRDEGLFSVEVLGLEIEDNERAKDIKHSSQRKFRPE